MADLHNNIRASIEIEVVEGGDQDTVPFILVGEDPNQIYQLPRKALERHIQRVQQQQAEIDALAREEAGEAPF